MTWELVERWRKEDAEGPARGNGDGVRAMFEASSDLSAEKVGRSLQLAAALGLPEHVVLEQADWAEQESLARDVERHPLLAKWAEADRQNAALTRDDAPGLIAVADALDFEAREQSGLSLRRAAGSGDEQARAELLRRRGASEEEIRFGAITQTPNPSPLEQMFTLGREGLDQVGKSLAGAAIMASENLRGQALTLPDWAAAGQAESEQARNARLRGLAERIRESVKTRERETPAPLRSESVVGSYAQDVVRMIPQWLAQISVAYATGGAGGMAFMGGQIAGDQYLELTDKGVEPDRAMFAALTNAGLQAPLEQIGMGKFMSIFKASGLRQALLRTGETVGTEMLTEYLQSYPDAATSIWAEAEQEGRSPEESVRYFLDRLGEIHEEGLYSALVAAPFGLLGGAGRVLTDATTAREARDFVAKQKELHGKVEACRTKSLAPDHMENFLQSVGLSGDVTLPADAVLELREAGTDILTPLGMKPEDWREAADAGQEVAVPLARLHARLDEAAFAAAADIMRPAPDAMNMRDAAALNENLSADMDGLVEAAEEDAIERSAIEGELERLRIEMTEAAKSIPHLMAQIVSDTDADTTVGRYVDAQLGLLIQRARALNRMGIPISETLSRVSFQGLVRDDAGRLVTPEEAEAYAQQRAEEEALAPFWDTVWGRLNADGLRGDFSEARRELAYRHGRGLFARKGEGPTVDELVDELKNRGLLEEDADSSTLIERLKALRRPDRRRMEARRNAASVSLLQIPAENNAVYPDNGKAVGWVTPEIAAALRLNKPGAIVLDDIGLQHIEERHGKEIRSLGFQDGREFVGFVLGNPDAVYAVEGSGRKYDLVSRAMKPQGRVMIRLEFAESGDFYQVVTAGPVRPEFYHKKAPLWERAQSSHFVAETPDAISGQSGNNSIVPLDPDDNPLFQSVRLGNPLASRFADMPMIDADSSAWFGEGKAIEADKKKLRSNLKEWARKNFSKDTSVSNADTGWEVLVTPRSIEKSLSHGFDELLARSVPFIPQIIEGGIHVASIEKKPGLMSHIFANKIRLDGRDYVVGFVLREDVNGNRFYDHELTEIINPDSLNADRLPGKGSEVHAARANRGDVMNILRDKLGVNDGTGRVLFQSPAVVVRGDELGVPEGAGIKDYQKAAREVYRELQKTPAHREDLGEIRFTAAGFGEIKKTGFDLKKWKMVPHLREIVESAEYKAKAELNKPRKDRIVAFHWLEATIELEGKFFRVGVNIAEDADGNKFYNFNEDLDAWEQKYKAPDNRSGQYTPGAQELLQDASASVASNIGTDADGVNLHILPRGGRANALGSTTADADGNYVIQLFRGADLSTLTHETAHVFFLEMERLEREGLADERMLADLAALREWTSVLDDDAALKAGYDRFMKHSVAAYGGAEFERLPAWLKEDARNRAKQEMLARGFEQYLREGKAPSRKLESVFTRFRKWLMRVYREARALHVELTDEVRDVFDRMLAHEEEMDLRAEAAGARDETARLLDALDLKGAKRLEIEGLITEAKAEAAEKLRRARDENRLKLLRGWAKEAKEQMEREKVYVARKAIRRTPIDLASFNDVNGEELGKALVKKLPGSATRREGGVEPETLAAELGYESAADMARDIVNSPTPGQRVKQIVDERQAEHDALFDADDYLFEQEQLAEQQERIAAALEEKMRAITAEQRYRREVAGKTVGGEEVRPTAEDYEDFGPLARWRVGRDQLRAQALTVLSKKPMGEEVLPEQFRRAASRWMQEERRGILRGDFGKALEANYKARLNIELAGRAAERRDLVNKLTKRTKKFLDMDKADPDARYATFWLAQNIGLFSPTRKMLANAGDKNRQNVDAFFARMREEGLLGQEDIDIWLFAEERRSWKGMTWEEFRPYAEAMTIIMHMERESRTANTAQGRVDLEAKAKEIAASIYANNAHREPGALVKRSKAGKLLREIHAAHLKADTIALLLDGDSMGPSYAAIMRPINEATWNRAERLRQGRDALKKLFSVYSRRELVEMKSKRFTVPGVAAPITKEQALGVLLNSGNASNLQRLMSGQKLTRDQVQAIIDTLDERDVRFAQSVWDYFETFRKESFDLEESLTGVRPEAVKAQPVQTRFGMLRGGYYPVAYDTDLSALPADQDKVGTQTSGRVASVDHGSMKQRTATGLGTPLALSLDVIPRHVSETAHMLAFRRPVLEVGKILRRKEVNGAIQETAGVEIAKALRDWLAYVAGERPARTGWNKAASWARKNAALYAMGFKLSTMLAQMTGLLAATSEIGLKWTLRGVADTYGRGNPFEAYRAVTALSPMMRHRIASVDRDVFEASSKLMDTGSTRRALDPFVRMKSFMETKGFVPMGVIQMAFADLPTWNGAYAKALTENGGDIEAAARYADAVVERTQVGGAEKDLAAVQRGSELGKLMTMFYSYFSALYNLSARRVTMLHRRRDAASVYRLGTLMLLTWFAEPVLMGTLLGKAPDDEGDEWEDWLSWGAKEAFFNPFNMVVGVRDVASMVDSYVSGHGGRYRLSSALDVFDSAMKFGIQAGKILEGDGDEKELVLAGGKAVGQATGFVNAQALLILETFWDWLDGTSPEWELGNLIRRKN